ncbi:MAG: family 16 glycosylhydrolase [Rikenellaceae bacterium]
MKLHYNIFTLLTSLLLLLTGCVESFPLPTIEDNQGWVYSTRYSDEFNGDELDSQKWHPNNPEWIGREPSLFLPKNVRVEDGMLILSSHREEPINPPSDAYHTFTSAAVQSVDTLHYGFYEIRAKAQNSAISSAFWLYVNDSLRQEEIDIFEICGRNDNDSSYEDTYFATAHYMRFKDTIHIKSSNAYRTGYKLSEQYIIAGLEWNEQEIIWYLNGVEIHRCDNKHWFSPETVNFDCETFPTWWGLPSDDDNGGEFKIDYFRFWTKK